jgi:hypothetical protein
MLRENKIAGKQRARLGIEDGQIIVRVRRFPRPQVEHAAAQIEFGAVGDQPRRRHDLDTFHQRLAQLVAIGP